MLHPRFLQAVEHIAMAAQRGVMKKLRTFEECQALQVVGVHQRCPSSSQGAAKR